MILYWVRLALVLNSCIKVKMQMRNQRVYFQTNFRIVIHFKYSKLWSSCKKRASWNANSRLMHEFYNHFSLAWKYRLRPKIHKRFQERNEWETSVSHFKEKKVALPFGIHPVFHGAFCKIFLCRRQKTTHCTFFVSYLWKFSAICWIRSTWFVSLFHWSYNVSYFSLRDVKKSRIC